MKPNATPLQPPCGPTVAVIVARLPKTPLVSPGDFDFVEEAGAGKEGEE